MRTLLVLCLLASCLSGDARRIVRGVVIAAAGAPVAGAAVRLADSDVSVASDQAGAFRLTTTATGKRSLAVSADGWFPVSMEVNLSSESRDIDAGAIRLKGPDCSSPRVICDDLVEPRKAVLVCDVTQNPLRHQGASVVVRGRLRGSGDAMWLAGENCKAGASVLRLVLPATGSEDDEAFQRVRADIQRRTAGMKDPEIWLTCSGRFEAGSGSQGSAPARLLLGTARDLLVLPARAR